MRGRVEAQALTPYQQCRHPVLHEALGDRHVVRWLLLRGLRQATPSAPRTAAYPILSPHTHTATSRVTSPRPALLQASAIIDKVYLATIDYMAEAEQMNQANRQSPASLRADITSICRAELQNDDFAYVRSDDEKRKVSASPPVTAPLLTAHLSTPTVRLGRNSLVPS